MTRLGAYLNDPSVRPHTPTCRIKAWSHDNAFTIIWVSGLNAIGWITTVITCH